MRALEQHPGRLEQSELVSRVREAARAVQRPILFSLLIIIAAYIPLLTLERVERRLFTPMALTVCFALLGSLLLCLTLVPVLATFVFRRRRRRRRHHLLEVLTARYEAIIRVTVRHAWLTVLVAAGVVAWALDLALRLGTEFLPNLDERLI